MVSTVTHITARSLLASMVLPATVREQAREILLEIEAGFAPFLVNQSHALGVGMVLGLQAADALSPELLKGLQNVFKAAQRAMLDQLSAKAASNLHAPVLMDEKAVFSAFHVRLTGKRVEVVQGNRYNEGWTEGASAAWSLRPGLPVPIWLAPRRVRSMERAVPAVMPSKCQQRSNRLASARQMLSASSWVAVAKQSLWTQPLRPGRVEGERP